VVNGRNKADAIRILLKKALELEGQMKDVGI